MSIITVRQAKVSDLGGLRDAVQDAPVDIVQLDQGKMTGTITHLSVGSVGVSTGDFALGLRSLGSLSDRRWSFASVLEAPALWQHFEATPGDLLILPANHELYARYFVANHYAATFIEPEEMFSFLAFEPGAQDAAVWREPAALLTADPTIAPARTRELRMLLGVLTRHGPTMTPEAADYYKRALLELMTAPVIDRTARRYRGPRLQSEVALVRMVEGFLDEAGSRPVHISELVAHAGVSRRSLYRAFGEVHRMPPMEFVRHKRLSGAHNALLTAASGMTVERAAIAHGFAHQGRFSDNYRALFGELPCETLHRSSRHQGFSTR